MAKREMEGFVRECQARAHSLNQRHSIYLDIASLYNDSYRFALRNRGI